jgi:hypothetical protein
MNLKTNQAKKKIATLKLAMLVTAIVTAVFAAPLLLSADASAQQDRRATASGRGDGFMRCPNGQSFFGGLGFAASENENGEVTGGWTFQGSGLTKTGALNDGHIGISSYSLRGLEVVPGCLTTGLVEISLKGQCGGGVIISFRADDREVGRFGGFVNCAETSVN